MQKEYGSHKGGVAGKSSIGCVSYAENLLLFTHTLDLYCASDVDVFFLFTKLTNLVDRP